MNHDPGCFSVNYAGTDPSWTEFTEFTSSEHRKDWIFRGQSEDKPLATSLERRLLSWGIDLTHGPAIEHALVRDFRRRLRGEEYTRVKDNTLYCLSLMQHHGAPTRLLDCTYSPFVAAQMAIKEGKREKDHVPPLPVAHLPCPHDGSSQTRWPFYARSSASRTTTAILSRSVAVAQFCAHDAHIACQRISPPRTRRSPASRTHSW